MVESGVWRAQVKASDHLPVYARIRWTTPEKAMRVSAPNLQNPTQGGITVGWQTTHPAYGWVEYGRSAQALDRRARTLVDGQVVCNTTTQKIRLKDLEPGTTYYYRTGTREMTLYEGYRKNFGDTLYSPVYSFRTPPAADKDEDFTVLIFDDLHQNRATIDSLMHHVRERGIGYDLVVFNGDVLSDPKDLPQAAAYLQHICKAVDAARVPVIFIRGNHEIRNAYSIGLREILDFLGPTTYGAFNWGTTRFVVLDCGEDKPDETPVYYDLNEFTGFREEQRDFLAAELPSPAFRQAAKRVLISHVPLYRAAPQTKPQPCRELWRPLIDAANPTFDLAIAGHVHRYGYTPVGADGNRFPAYTVGGSTPAVANVVVLSYRAGQLSWDFIPGKGL